MPTALLRAGRSTSSSLTRSCPIRDAELPISLDFQGLGIWFLCQRTGETFHMRHVIVEIDEQGKFSRGHVGEQEGYSGRFSGLYIG